MATERRMRSQQDLSIPGLLKERKRWKKAKTFGVSTESLLLPPKRSPQSISSPYNPRTHDFEQAIATFTCYNRRASVPNPCNQWTAEEPKEVSLASQSWNTPANVLNRQESEIPSENLFFQLPLPTVATDEECYEEFRTRYFQKGLEDTLLRLRRKRTLTGTRKMVNLYDERS